MAARKPLVIRADGEIEELPSSDTLDASASEVDVISKANGEAGAITICQPVFVASDGDVELANSGADGTYNVLGLVKDSSISAGNSGLIQTDGLFIATTGQWDAVTGDTGGLTPGAKYYLDSTDGTLKEGPPASGWIVKVGTALSTTELEVSIQVLAKKQA